LKGTFLVTKAALGLIINIGSVAGQIGVNGAVIALSTQSISPQTSLAS
jgi:hypothetical protein